MANHNPQRPPQPQRVVDALELAKVVAPSGAPPAPVTSPAAAAPVAPVSAPDGPAAPLTPAPVARGPVTPRVTVLEDKTISLRGQSAIMRKGRVLTPEFVTQHLATLQAFGVKLSIEDAPAE